jgi:hypothetical protein
MVLRLARLPGLEIRRPCRVVHFVCWWSQGGVPASLTKLHRRSKSKKLPIPPREIALRSWVKFPECRLSGN